MCNGLRAAACFALLIAGCTNTAEPGAYAAPLCAADGSCADSARCVAGVCHDTCAADADCPASALCRDAVCWASVSGACTSDSDCTMGEECIAGGCATPPSTIACADDADCPAGAACDGGSCVSRPASSAEICGNGIDDDGDGLIDEECGMPECASDSDCPRGEACVRGTCVGGMGDDADGDGYTAPADCDDSDASVHPGAAETCDRVDNNCDGTIDEGCGPMTCASDSDCSMGEACVRGTCVGGMGDDADGDGYTAPADCDDSDARVHPGAAETCDRVDNNCDGTIDEGCGAPMTCASDSDCAAGQTCLRSYCM